MRFLILGPLEVYSDAGDPIPIPGARPRALLVRLLLEPGQVVEVERLGGTSANAVQASVSRLRRALGADLVEFTAGGYRLAIKPEEVDLHRFERLAREGHRLVREGRLPLAAAVLKEALALWRGPALADLPDAGAQVVRLEEMRLVATEDLIDAMPEGTQEVGELRRLVAEHPFRERLRGQLMRALYASGAAAEALAEYDELRRILADELGTDPSPELAAIHLEILRGDKPAKPALPVPLTGIVGREREIEMLAGARTRLVTVIGPGGIGKTRLAIEAASHQRGAVCFVDLSRVDDDAQVPHAVISALGLTGPGFPGSAPTAPAQRLVAALADEEVKLIVDNCEQVVGAVAALMHRVLTGCPNVSVLATSREPLGLTGEILVPLEPLAIDGPPGDAPAVRLFVERAAAVRPGFALNNDNVEAVVSICRLLDGLPLAIELAAARLRQFEVTAIAGRLVASGHFALLSRGDRTAAERHRTLRGVVDWSWHLLKNDERALAQRFAVFQGGAPAEAIEAVCNKEEDLLADLVDRSLITVRDGRYRMLDTIRLYCKEKLADAGEAEAMNKAHARYHLQLARRADPHLRREEQLEWLEKLKAEHDNLMTALRWSVAEEPETAMRLVAALAAYWWLSGRRGGVAELANDAIAEEPPQGLEEEWASCVMHAGSLADRAQRRRADEVMHAITHPLRHPFGVAVWALTSTEPGRGERKFGDSWTDALHLLGDGLLNILGGHVAKGEKALEDGLDEFRSLGERWGTAQSLDWLAYVAAWRGEWQRADRLWAEALTALSQLGAGQEIAELLCHRAECAIRRGRFEAAEEDLEAAGRQAARAGLPSAPHVETGFADLAREIGDLAEAQRRIAKAMKAVHEGDIGIAYSRASVLTASARIAETNGDLTTARNHHRLALDAARTVPMAAITAAAAEGLAGTVALAGGGERAALLLGLAVALRGIAVTADPDVARAAATSTALVGPEAFAAAYARGVALSRGDALSTLTALSADA